MWSMLAIIAVAILIFFLEYPKLKKQNKKKDLWFFTIILLFFTIISVLESREFSLPNPLDYIKSFYKMF
ncbi:hypothetical protein [Halobacillus sp. H74]|uniref:hypothetical protein n=1 Tax=Halobacillus sp. H74 TaxID=3457436 RepID=UPI003FCC5224